MSLFDIFKKKGTKEKKRKAARKPKAEKVEKIEKPPKASAVEKPRPRRKKEGVSSYKILKSPHITEKATDLLKQNQYVFRVWPRSNKTEIKKTIEGMYGVEVVNVKVINIHPKRRRLGRTLGWRGGYKKAIIRIKEGQKIEVLPR